MRPWHQIITDIRQLRKRFDAVETEAERLVLEPRLEELRTECKTKVDEGWMRAKVADMNWRNKHGAWDLW